MPDDPKPWVSITDAMRISGFGRSGIHYLINRGDIETKKIGRRRYIVRKSLEELPPDPHPNPYPYKLPEMPSSLTVSRSISF